MEKTKQQYDFYFSRKDWERRLPAIKRNGGLEDFCIRCYVNGTPYTEMIRHGKEPVTKWMSDLVLVYSGVDYVITNKKVPAN